MPSRQKSKKKSSTVGRLKDTSKNGTRRSRNELVVITGMSGSGKASVLKAFEDLGYYCVDNLPIELIPQFAELAQNSEYERTALVVDIREGGQFRKLPSILKSLKERLQMKVIFLEATEDILIRRFSETRRPHPLGKAQTVPQAIAMEREQLNEIRNASDFIIDTSKFNVHDLRAHALDKFRRNASENAIAVSCLSFGYKHGVPQDCDLLFDVRFLPNPHFIPELRPFTGRDPKVAKYVLS